jgi:hypothetical protein
MSTDVRSMLMTTALVGLMAGLPACGGSAEAPKPAEPPKVEAAPVTPASTEAATPPADGTTTTTTTTTTAPATDAAAVQPAGPPAAHDCKAKNECKGTGGCSAGDQGCKGKNTCKGKGGCKTT